MAQCPKITLRELPGLLLTARRVGRALMIWGPPGVGKTETVRATFASAKVVEVYASTLEPGDVTGPPVPDVATGQLRWPIPPIFGGVDPADPERPPLVIFLDELPTAGPLVKNALLKLCLEKAVGEYALRGDDYVVAAGNRAEHGAFVSGLGGALANRFIHVEIRPDLEAWLEWAAVRGVRREVIQFLVQNPGLFLDQTRWLAEQEDTFPSPRAWVALSDLLDEIERSGGRLDADTVALFAGAAVGPTAGNVLAAWWEKKRDLPPIHEILRGQAKAVKDLDHAAALSVIASATPVIIEAWHEGGGAEGKAPEFLEHLAQWLEASGAPQTAFSFAVCAIVNRGRVTFGGEAIRGGKIVTLAPTWKGVIEKFAQLVSSFSTLFATR